MDTSVQPHKTCDPRTGLGAVGICVICLFSIGWIVDTSVFFSFGVQSTGGLLTWIAAILIAALWKNGTVYDSAEAILLAFYAGYAIAYIWVVVTIMHFGYEMDYNISHLGTLGDNLASIGIGGKMTASLILTWSEAAVILKGIPVLYYAAVAIFSGSAVFLSLIVTFPIPFIAAIVSRVKYGSFDYLSANPFS